MIDTEKNIPVKRSLVLLMREGWVCPYGAPGDRLWVRESYAELDKNVFCYKADFKEEDQHPKWKPPIFMPRIAAAILLEITNLRVERLQDITEEDAIGEGILPIKVDGMIYPQWFDYCKDYKNGYANPVNSFRSLWNSINIKKGFGWTTNPWVWVIEFKRIEE